MSPIHADNAPGCASRCPYRRGALSCAVHDQHDTATPSHGAAGCDLARAGSDWCASRQHGGGAARSRASDELAAGTARCRGGDFHFNGHACWASIGLR